MNEKLWWYVARSSGIVAWGLVAASVFWGLFLSTRVLSKRPTPAWLLDLHKFLGGTSVAFTGVHLLALVADSYAHFDVVDLLVPMASEWKPGPVAWGVVGFYLLVAIEATSLFMRRIPRAWWRAVHMTSFLLFVLSTVHAFTAGTDRGNVSMQWAALVVSAVFIFLVAYRQAAPRRGRGGRRAKPATGTPAPATRTAPRTPHPAS